MTQAVNWPFELLFLFCVLISLICLITAVVLALRARRHGAKRLLVGLGTGWVAYLVVVFVVAAATPQRVIPMDRDLCFDEMCFAVINVQTASELGSVSTRRGANGMFYIVRVRIRSRARGRAQSENGLRARLWSPYGEYEISPAGQSAWNAAHPESVALTARLRPGQSVFSDQVFEVPARATDFGLVLSNGFTPSFFVIGECPLFHKPTVLRSSQ